MKKLLLAMALILTLMAMTACGEQVPEEAETTQPESIETETTAPALHAPRESAAYQWMNVEEAVKELNEAGFLNIETQALEDICVNSPIADGAVESVEIDGASEFDASTPFPEDAKVHIVFHSIPKLKPPVSPEEAAAFGYMDVGKRYFHAGFTNVHTDEVYDLDPGTKARTEVTLEGKAVTEDMELPFDGEIHVTGHFPRSLYSVKLTVDFWGNVLFSKYDVDVQLNGETLGQVLHGERGKFPMELEEGSYTLSFAKTDDSSITGEVKFEVHSDSDIKYMIYAHSDEITSEIMYEKTALREGQIKLPYSHEHYLRMDAEQAAQELKELGFTDVTIKDSNEAIWDYSPVGTVVSLAIDGKQEFSHDDFAAKSAAVEVSCHVCDFTFTENEAAITEKESFEIPYTLTSGDPLESISFVIDDETIVKQNEEGKFDALIPGNTTITAVCGGRVCSKCDVTVEEIIVPIESVTLSTSEVNAVVGSYFDLSYTYEPQNSNYTDIQVTLSSTLVEDCGEGRYYAAAPGDTEIIFAQDDRVLAVCKVHAEVVEITGLTIGEAPSEIVIGEKIEIPFTLAPENATIQGITAACSNQKTAEILFDERGSSSVQVTGIAAGKTDLIITVPDGTQYKYPIEVREILPEKLEIVKQNPDTVLQVGTPIALDLHWTPEETSIQEVTWQSSNSRVIKIGPDGTMEAVGVGKATLTARHKSGVAAKLELTIQPTPVERIEISTDYDGDDFVKGNKMQLIAKVFPENATDQRLTWSSSDKTVLTVNSQGLVTAMGEGYADITVESRDGVKAVYPLGANPAPQKYSVSWTLTQVSNDHVGSRWTKGGEINGESCSSGTTITMEPGATLAVNVWVQDNDSNPDYDAHFAEIELTEEVRKNGFVEEGELHVYENGGRYSGNEAVWRYKITVKPLNW